MKLSVKAVLLLSAIPLGLGVQVSKSLNRSSRVDAERLVSSSKGGVIALIDGDAFTWQDLDFDIKLMLDGIPRENDQILSGKGELEEQLAAQGIERIVLFRYIAFDTSFQRDDPQRYVDCIRLWREVVVQHRWIQSDYERDRLKRRLCQEAVIGQYWKEKLSHNFPKNVRSAGSSGGVTPRAIVGHIFTATRARAEAIRRKVTRQNFSQIAEEESESPEGQKGGKIGPFARGQLPPVFDVAFSLKVGELSSVLQSSYGFHIILLLQKFSGEDESLEEKIKVSGQANEEVYKKWVEQALQRVVVSVPKH